MSQSIPSEHSAGDQHRLDYLQEHLANLQRQHKTSVTLGLNPNTRIKLESEIEATKKAIEAINKT